jgi:flagellar motor switch protein FliN/FliY
MAAEQPPNPSPDPLKAGEAAGAKASGSPAPADFLIDQASIDELLKQASFEDPSAFIAASASAPAVAATATVTSPPDPSAAAIASVPNADGFKLPNFQQVLQDAQVSSIDLLRDVELNVKIELGRSRMLVEDVLKLAEGSVVELDKLAGDPVDVFVNDRLVARGEVLVLNDNFCVRVNEIVAGVKEEGL